MSFSRKCQATWRWNSTRSLRLIRSGATTVTSDLVGRIRSKFQPIADSPRMAQALDDLDLLISRKRPSSPEKAWGEADWIRWATDEYLPYRFWQENTGQIDDEIVEFASQYADWLQSNFGKLRYNSPNMAWKAMLGLKDEIKTHSGPVLVIVADNLNAKFHPDLQAQMQRQGYYEHSLAYCFSMLPSCTEVSKKCVMTGHYVPFDGQFLQKAGRGDLGWPARQAGAILVWHRRSPCGREPRTRCLLPELPAG